MILLNGRELTVEQVIRVSRGYEKAAIAEEAKGPMDTARAYVEKKVEENAVVYGLTTGFGKFQDKYISKEDTAALQRNLIVSHACAMGEPFPEDVTRGIMLLRCNALCRGNSGIRRSTVETLLAMLNAGVTPVIPQKGSLGASGDLAPLAHMVLVMIGEGEGLALINGTQVMTSAGLHALYGAMKLMKTADIASAMTTEAQLGITKAFDKRVHELRGHAGQLESAENIARLLQGSRLSFPTQPNKVQDAYSIRCAPQIHGASRDAIGYVYSAVSREINAVTDNPIIFPDDDDAISGGNFHGQPMALAFDFLGIAVSELADVSERRLERMVNPQLSNGLPAFLTKDGGLNSGFMIAQYAAASMVSENKVYAHPASVDSIPSSANQEDHVSMGTTAARKAGMILDNAEKVIAIELFAAFQALHLRGSEKLAPATKAVWDEIAGAVEPVKKDVVMYPRLNALEKLVRDGSIIKAAESVCGELN